MACIQLTASEVRDRALMADNRLTGEIESMRRARANKRAAEAERRADMGPIARFFFGSGKHHGFPYVDPDEFIEDLDLAALRGRRDEVRTLHRIASMTDGLVTLTTDDVELLRNP